MNERLSDDQTERLLLTLERALVHIRAACCDADLRRAEAIADAFHNLPRLLSKRAPDGWSVAAFETLFLEPLVEAYPDLWGFLAPR